MPVIHYKNAKLTLPPKKTVLEGLLDANYDIPHACKAGACQSCKMQATSGSPPALSQAGLTQGEKNLGYFLSCICTPSEDLTLGDNQSATQYDSEVLDISLLNAQVLRVRLNPVFDFVAGQYFTIWHNGNTPRSYSIASSPSDGFIECHIKLIENGQFSPYAHNTLKIGDTLRIQGPMGSCIYAPQKIEQPILLAGIGTGLAPIYGITKQALAQGHCGPIHLICGAKTSQGLYLVKELKTLETQYDNFRVSFVVQTNNTGITSAIEGDIYHYCKSEHPSTKGFEIFLCGAQSFVTKLKKQSFLLGANMPNIHTDAFVSCS